MEMKTVGIQKWPSNKRWVRMTMWLKRNKTLRNGGEKKSTLGINISMDWKAD